MQLKRLFHTIACLALASAGAIASATDAPAPYAELAPMIGDWNVGPDGGAPAFIERFSWGPNRGYIRFSVSLLAKAGEEHLHLDGMIIWNAGTRRYDYLLAVEPGSFAQERGEFYRKDDGQIVRDVTLTSADGSVGKFRQTFRALPQGRFDVTLMRQTAGGWEPTFPGSDRLVMVRQNG